MKIYHNPRCSKSRQTLKLIKDAGITPTIILYLDDKLSANDIVTLLRKLGFASAKDLLRKGEADYMALNLKSVDSENELIAAMVAYPKLIERPIVERGDRAILGRPPENVLNLLDDV